LAGKRISHGSRGCGQTKGAKRGACVTSQSMRYDLDSRLALSSLDLSPLALSCCPLPRRGAPELIFDARNPTRLPGLVQHPDSCGMVERRFCAVTDRKRTGLNVKWAIPIFRTPASVFIRVVQAPQPRTTHGRHAKVGTRILSPADGCQNHQQNKIIRSSLLTQTNPTRDTTTAPSEVNLWPNRKGEKERQQKPRSTQ